MSEKPNLCIAVKSKIEYSQTFILNHVKRLPGVSQFIFGERYPSRVYGVSETGELHRSSFFNRIKLLFKAKEDDLFNRSLAIFFRENKINCVLAEFASTGVAVLEACRLASVPLIVHFHGYDAYAERCLSKNRDRYIPMFDYASAIIAVSKDMVGQVISLGACKDKVHYVSCGVDISFFKICEPEKNPPAFISVGRFVDKKAPHLTLLAFSKIAKKIPASKLVMIGDGVLLEACQNLAVSLDVAGQVEFLGVKTHEEVQNAMSKARVFVQHSLKTSEGDSEGTPVSILEAGASGLPVVATSHAGIKDAVIHGETGFLVKERDVNQMAFHMEQLALNPVMASSMGKAARKQIEENFSMEKSIHRLHQIACQVLKNKKQ